MSERDLFIDLVRKLNAVLAKWRECAVNFKEFPYRTAIRDLEDITGGYAVIATKMIKERIIGKAVDQLRDLGCYVEADELLTDAHGNCRLCLLPVELRHNCWKRGDSE